MPWGGARGVRAGTPWNVGKCACVPLPLRLLCRPVRSAGDLYAALDARKAGERVRLDVLRDGKATSLTLVLGERGLTGSLEE